MRFLLLLSYSVIVLSSPAQAQKTRNLAWYTPSSCTTSKINGLAFGLLTGCLRDPNEDYLQVINGLDLEIFGTGFLLPLAGGYDASGNGFFYKGWEQEETDTVCVFYTIVNGLAVSSGGIAGDDVKVNGINIAGLYTMTGKVNGICIGGLLRNINRFVNGVCIGGLFRNESIQTNGIQIGGFFNASKRIRGVQIGLINQTKDLKGVQIGLWNTCGRRSLPLLNFQF